MGEVAQIQFSNVDKLTIEGETPVRLCNYVDVYRNDRISAALDFMEATADAREIQKFQIQPGDVLLTKDSEAPTDIAIPSVVGEPLPGVLCGYHLAMVRPVPTRSDGRFVSWVHTAKSLRAQYEARAVGVTRFGLSQDAFKTARLPLPPLDEQKRIAAFLDASCAAIDAAMAAKRGQIDAIEALRGSATHNALTRGRQKYKVLRGSGSEVLGDVPASWRLGPLGTFAIRTQAGMTPPTEQVELYEDGTIPWFSPGSFEAGLGLGPPRKLINDAAVKLGVLRIFPAGTVLLVGIGATLGKVAVADAPCAFNQQVVGIVASAHLRPRFLGYQLSLYERYFLATAPATTLPILDTSRLRAVVVVAPPLAEQDEIIAYLDGRLADLSRLTDNIRAQITALTAYRQSLVHECVTGQRRVTDADVRRAEAVRK